jgi:glutamate synthase domain-containing protein 1
MVRNHLLADLWGLMQGMLKSVAVGAFYKDLKNPLFESSFALYHRRFSTNTTPKWPLAQPMRVLGHNGTHPLATTLPI